MIKPASLTIAIPAYNEEHSLAAVIEDALTFGPQLARSFELLLINDGSTDATEAIMRTYAKKDKRIKMINHHPNRGFSGAIKSCYANATSQWIFLAPADGQITMDIIPLFIAKTKHADVIVGYRTTNPEPFSRKINSWVFHTFYRILFGVPLQEISTAILWNKKILDQITITALDRSALIQPEVIYKAFKHGATFAQVGFPYHHRTGGVPKGTDPWMIFLTIKELLRLRLTV